MPGLIWIQTVWNSGLKVIKLEFILKLKNSAMIGCCLWTVDTCPQATIALYFEFVTLLKFYNLEAWSYSWNNFLKKLIKKSVDKKAGKISQFTIVNSGA